MYQIFSILSKMHLSGGVGQLNKLLNYVKIVKHSIQHYLTCKQPRDLHCLYKKV